MHFLDLLTSRVKSRLPCCSHWCRLWLIWGLSQKKKRNRDECWGTDGDRERSILSTVFTDWLQRPRVGKCPERSHDLHKPCIMREKWRLHLSLISTSSPCKMPQFPESYYVHTRVDLALTYKGNTITGKEGGRLWVRIADTHVCGPAFVLLAPVCFPTPTPTPPSPAGSSFFFPTSRVCFQGDLPNKLEPEWSMYRVTPGKSLPNSTGWAWAGFPALQCLIIFFPLKIELRLLLLPSARYGSCRGDLF